MIGWHHGYFAPHLHQVRLPLLLRSFPVVPRSFLFAPAAQLRQHSLKMNGTWSLWLLSVWIYRRTDFSSVFENCTLGEEQLSYYSRHIQLCTPMNTSLGCIHTRRIHVFQTFHNCILPIPLNFSFIYFLCSFLCLFGSLLHLCLLSVLKGESEWWNSCSRVSGNT